jgi:hypothetical protein
MIGEHHKQVRRSSRHAAPLSPNTIKRFKRIQIKNRKGVQKRAFNKLLKMRATNGGNAKRGDFQTIVKKYKSIENGNVTKGVLNYMVLCNKRMCKENLPSTIAMERSILDDISSLSIVSSHLLFCDVFASETETGDTNEANNSGGRPKGSTKVVKAASKKKINDTTHKAAKMLAFEKDEANKNGKQLAVGRLKSILENFEIQSNLVPGTLHPETIGSRAKRRNYSGLAWQKNIPTEESRASSCTVLSETCKHWITIVSRSGH